MDLPQINTPGNLVKGNPPFMQRKTLKLVLKGKWFDLIASGEKKEEYRDITPFYTSRLVDKQATEEHNANNHFKSVVYKDFDSVEFYLGYASNRPTMLVECLGISKSYGKDKWGAGPGVVYYNIKLGKIINKSK